MRDPSERGASLSDFLFGMARDAIADIRGKLIDEGWFGRQAPEAMRDIPDQGPVWPDHGEETALDRLPAEFFTSPSFEEQWAVRPPGERGQEPQGLDLDR